MFRRAAAVNLAALVVGAAIFCCQNSRVATLPVSSRPICRTIFRSENWFCFACGNANVFHIVSIDLVDGKPKVEWEPKVNRWTGTETQAVLKGAESLDGDWHEVDKASGSDKAKFRFFKVAVELP